MSNHDHMLDDGPRSAPEPETAEERSKRVGLKTGGGAIAGGAVAAAKLGFLTKFFIWWFAWRGVVDAWRIGSWIGLAVVVAIIATVLVVRHSRKAAA